MNLSRITAFGGAAHSETDLADDNASLSIEEFLATVLGKKDFFKYATFFSEPVFDKHRFYF
jgi:hypothetical protein